MKVTVRYRGQLATAMGVASEEMELPQGSTPASLVREISARASDGFASLMVDGDGVPRRSLLVAIDGEQAVDYDEVLCDEVREVVLMPPIAGG